MHKHLGYKLSQLKVSDGLAVVTKESDMEVTLYPVLSLLRVSCVHDYLIVVVWGTG